MKTIFISHAVADKKIVQPFEEMIRKLSLGQITSWCSSNDTISNGIKPGENWFKKIISKIEECDSMIVLLTPNSINNKWIHFEVGMAYGLNKPLFPICIGLGISEVTDPLKQLQLCQIGDYESTNKMIHNFFESYGLILEDDIGHNQIMQFIKVCSDTFATIPNNQRKLSPVEKSIEELRAHIDKRLVEFAQIGIRPEIETLISYSVRLDIRIDNHNERQFIEIKSTDSIQDVLNRVYFLIENHVNPYTYLKDWIIREKESKSAVVVYEIADLIPATIVFKPNTTWILERLIFPYESSKSKFYNGRGLNRFKTDD